VGGLIKKLELTPVHVRPEQLDDMAVLFRHIAELKVDPAKDPFAIVPRERKRERVPLRQAARDLSVARAARLG
jgi:hypothetical protein